MKLLLRKLEAEWPAWTAIVFLLLLPVKRLSDVPLAVFALAMPFLWRSAAYGERTRAVFFAILPLFLCFWLPMVLSAFDSFNPDKSWSQSLVNLRFLLAAVSIGVLLHRRSHRTRVLMGAALILLFWAIDGFVQLAFGRDLFGIPAQGDRLNAMFVDNYQFYGPVMAMLSPLLLEYARRHWHGWAWAASFAVITGAVLISGMRSGWVVMTLVVMVYAVLMLRRENRELRRITLAIPAILILVIATTYATSPLLQERVAVTLAVTQGTTESLDKASSLRVPIFTHAVEMFRDHPVNGVGVRAFSTAYMDYAGPDDPHVLATGGVIGARHAHNVILELMADMGTIGVLGYILGWFFALRLWYQMTPDQRQGAFPFAFALFLILFPMNTHFALYGSYTSMLIWFLIGCWASVLAPETPVRRLNDPSGKGHPPE